MKHFIIFLLAISLFSCSLFNKTKVDFSIKNSSKKTLRNIVFKTSLDSITIKELQPNESFEKELRYNDLSNENESSFKGFRLSFFRGNVKNDDFGCFDVSYNRSKKKVHLIVLEKEIKADIKEIECY